MADERKFDPNDPLAPRALEPVLFRFVPQFEGAFLRNVPARDLTESDVRALEPLQRRDALAPHPGHGTPLYVATEVGEAWLAAQAAAADELDAAVAAEAAATQEIAKQPAGDERKRKKAAGTDQEPGPDKDGDA